MGIIGARALSAIIASGLLGLLAWLVPNFSPEMMGATTTDRISLFYIGLFSLFYAYLFIQGWPISHGQIGDSSTHNWDNIVSGLPAVAAFMVLFLHMVGFRHVSFTIVVFSAMLLAVVAYDLIIIGGAAAKINRLTDEYKSER